MNSIKKNFFYNSMYQILVLILPLMTVPYISRIMGPSGVGIYSYSFSIANYLYLIAMLGVNNYGNRSIAMVRDNRQKLTETFWGIYYLQLFLSLIISVVYLICVIEFVGENRIIYLLQVIYIISAAFDINWFCFGLEEFKMTVIRNIAIKFANVAAIFLFVKSSSDLWLYTLIMGTSLLLSQIVIWPFVIKNIYFKFPKWDSIKSHLRPNLILFIPVISISLYKIMDKIMLGTMSSVEQVGYYTNALKIVDIPMGLITALGTVMLPRMSNIVAKGDFENSKGLITKSMTFAIFMGSAFTFGISGIAPVFTPWFFGNKFLDAVPLIIGLSITIIFISWANVVRTQYLIPNRKDRIYILSVICGAVVNLVINICLIPIFGAIGAVIGTIVAEATVCIVQTWKVRKELDIIEYIKNVVIFLVIGLVMFLTIRVIPLIFSGMLRVLIVQILVGIFLYFILSLLYLIKIKKEQKIINSILAFFHIKKRID